MLTNGGRVLAVTALGETVAAARALAYEAVGQIQFEGCHYRRDIASAPWTQDPLMSPRAFLFFCLGAEWWQIYMRSRPPRLPFADRRSRAFADPDAEHTVR